MYNKKYFYAIIIASAALFSTSCIFIADSVVGKGTIIAQHCNVDNFTSIEVASSVNVEISKGDSFEVILSDYENLIELWDIKVTNNTLVIQSRPFSSIVNTRAKVTIVMPDQLQSAIISGSGNVNLNSAFSNFSKATISGSGCVNSNFITEYSNLNIRISGSGKVNLKGTAYDLKVLSSGSGQISFSQLYVQNAECTMAGSGDMYVNVEQNLVATLSGSGNIIYYGNPVLDISDSGSGRLIKK